jgi:serine/threonine-protein kinase HipA
VQWYFDNLLPEETLRSVIAKEASLRAEDAFGLLAFYGAESAGSLVLRDPGEPAEAPHGLRPLAPSELNRRVVDLPRVSLTRDAPKRMSLAGAQHKMLVVIKDGALFEPLPGTPSTHILKPDHPSEHHPASVMNEFFTMRLAKAVGLDVPGVAHLYVPQPVYLVERFDRVHHPGTDESLRRHVVDTCQLLNKARTFKYSAANLDTLVQAIERCRAKAAARLQLYRWVVFNVLVGNGDNHIKNLSFLMDGSGIHVAPAYDLLCTAVYETRAMADDKERWPHTSLALHLGEARTFASVSRERLLEAGRVLGLPESAARRELQRLLRELPVQADKLIAEIEGGIAAKAAASPDPVAAQLHVAGDVRLLKAVRHIVLADMLRQVEGR